MYGMVFIFKGLKATNERQDLGQVYCTKWHNSLQTKYTYIQGAHTPLPPCKTQRDKILAAEQVDLYAPLN